MLTRLALAVSSFNLKLTLSLSSVTDGRHQLVPKDVREEAEKYAKVTHTHLTDTPYTHRTDTHTHTLQTHTHLTDTHIPRTHTHTSQSAGWDDESQRGFA